MKDKIIIYIGNNTRKYNCDVGIYLRAWNSCWISFHDANFDVNQMVGIITQCLNDNGYQIQWLPRYNFKFIENEKLLFAQLKNNNELGIFEFDIRGKTLTTKYPYWP